jgi:hypothetical protein
MGDGYDDPEWEPSKRRRTGYYSQEDIDRDYKTAPVAVSGPAGYAHTNLANCHNRFIHQNVIVAFGEGFGKVSSIADLSAGDARVPRALADYSDIIPILGDYADYGYQYTGPIEVTMIMMPPVELYVSTNTLEHLNNPDAHLALVRQKCEKLLLSVPIDEHDAGGQHLWFWTREGVEDMTKAAGFAVQAYCELDEGPVWEHFKFGIWALA